MVKRTRPNKPPKPTKKSTLIEFIASARGLLVILLVWAIILRVAWWADWYDYSHYAVIYIAAFVLFCGLYTISDILAFQKRTKTITMYAFSIVVGLGLISFFVWIHSQTPAAKYQELKTTGIITNAVVNKITLINKTVAFINGGPDLRLPVHSIGDANMMILSITYIHGRTADIPIRWGGTSRNTYLVLYNQAHTTRQIQIRYLPSSPQIVVPEVEFFTMGLK